MKENIGAADEPQCCFRSSRLPNKVLPTRISRCGDGLKRRRLKKRDLTGREDLTPLPFITIDPADARDHDDAVLCRSRH